MVTQGMCKQLQLTLPLTSQSCDPPPSSPLQYHYDDQLSLEMLFCAHAQIYLIVEHNLISNIVSLIVVTMVLSLFLYGTKILSSKVSS